VGGGFGAKSSLYPEELTLCAIARLLARPVKWISDRREDLLTSTQAWDEIVEAELALQADGTIVGLRAEVIADIGAYSSQRTSREAGGLLGWAVSKTAIIG